MSRAKRPCPFDPERLRLPPNGPELFSRRPSRLPRPGKKQPFLKGPIPLAWLTQAGQLPHRALQVGILLWFEAGCRRKRTIRFCYSGGRTMELSRDTTRRGLRELERAGLVSVVRNRGRGLEVTIWEVLIGAEE